MDIEEKKTKVLEALMKMDPTKDGQWTIKGEANLNTVKFLSGVEVTREEFDIIAPGFNREALTKAFANNSGAPDGPTPPSGGPGTGNDTADAAEDKAESDGGIDDGEVEVEALASQIDRTGEEILEFQRVSDEALTRLAIAQKKLDELHAAHKRLVPPEHPMQTIKAYQEQVKRQAEGRAHAQRMISQSGADLNLLAEMMAVSPLDQAFAMRGRQRLRRR